MCDFTCDNAGIQTIEVKVQPKSFITQISLFLILSQDGRPIAFFSRMLSSAEKNHHAVEKEALAIVEAVLRWRHFLMARHFISYIHVMSYYPAHRSKSRLFYV